MLFKIVYDLGHLGMVSQRWHLWKIEKALKMLRMFLSGHYNVDIELMYSRNQNISNKFTTVLIVFLILIHEWVVRIWATTLLLLFIKLQKSCIFICGNKSCMISPTIKTENINMLMQVAYKMCLEGWIPFARACRGAC